MQIMQLLSDFWEFDSLAEFTNHDSVDCFVAVVEVLFSLSLLLH